MTFYTKLHSNKKKVIKNSKKKQKHINPFTPMSDNGSFPSQYQYNIKQASEENREK